MDRSYNHKSLSPCVHSSSRISYLTFVPAPSDSPSSTTNSPRQTILVTCCCSGRSRWWPWRLTLVRSGGGRVATRSWGISTSAPSRPSRRCRPWCTRRSSLCLRLKSCTRRLRWLVGRRSLRISCPLHSGWWQSHLFGNCVGLRWWLCHARRRWFWWCWL